VSHGEIKEGQTQEQARQKEGDQERHEEVQEKVNLFI